MADKKGYNRISNQKNVKNMATAIVQKSKKRTNLSRYEGEWVAFLEDRVISHKDNLPDLVKEIEKRGVRKKASVFLVPRKDEGPYIL